MKQSVKKSVRYIYASVLAGVLFLIFYVLIRLSFVLSLVGMLGAYVAGIFLFRKKDVISYDPKSLMEYSFEASRIQNFATQFQEEGVVKDLKSICQTSEKLLNMLEQKKEKATQLYRFFDYYLDLTLYRFLILYCYIYFEYFVAFHCSLLYYSAFEQCNSHILI